MERELSRTQIDRLGDRLRKGHLTDDDLQLLDQYRRSFTEAYEWVAPTIRYRTGLEPTGRPAKSTTSIVEKLRRESIRLTQIQDIAGCRLVVAEIAEQDFLVESLIELFPNSNVVDRRHKPSHGYRAVHVIALINGKAVEIQVRTALQQIWAEVSEKLSDQFDPSIKYGGGDEFVKNYLNESSALIEQHENKESLLLKVKNQLYSLVSTSDLTQDQREAIITLQDKAYSYEKDLAETRQGVLRVFRDFNEELPRLAEGQNDISD
jgi:putative GTP pyrophosphokinase